MMAWVKQILISAGAWPKEAAPSTTAVPPATGPRIIPCATPFLRNGSTVIAQTGNVLEVINNDWTKDQALMRPEPEK